MAEVVWRRAGPVDESVLDERERARARAFGHAADRARYVTGHTLVRTLLAGSLGIAAEAVPVSYECADCGGWHGGPAVPGAWVSLSHAGTVVAVAISMLAPVGIDLERYDALFPGFDDVALHPAERVALASHPDPDRARMRWWTRKEALLKASGDGLRTDPRTQAVHESDPGIHDVVLDPAYACAVVAAPADALVIRRW